MDKENNSRNNDAAKARLKRKIILRDKRVCKPSIGEKGYNMMFAFTSPRAKLDRSINNGAGPPTIRIQGQSCHRIGNLLSLPGHAPKFAQLYIYDTKNEIHNWIQSIRSQKNIDAKIVSKLSAMLDEYNVHAKSFRMEKGRLKTEPVHDLKTECKLQRIDELHTSYLCFQYPLLFPYGEDGYRHDVFHRSTHTSQKRIQLTIKEWLCFRIQTRPNEPQTLLQSRRLFQQFLVDGYTILEAERLNFIRRNQAKLRVDKYCNLTESQQGVQTKGSSRGKRVILLPFIGGRRYMDQLYFDGMIICSHVGFLDLNERLLKSMDLKAPDQPDIVSRVFRIKFEELLADLTKKHTLGKVVAYGYSAYRRRDNGHTVLKKDVIVDNHTVSTSIKYLFKYINKGYDRITTTIVPTEHQVSCFGGVIDEIKQCLDCRYMSPTEACWIIFCFPIHSRKPTVERLFFHLPGEQVVYFKYNIVIGDVLLNPSVTEPMFTSWMDANRKYLEAKNLTYTQFVSKFVYVKTRRTWKPRKSGYTIGRLMRTMGNIEYSTFKEACFAMGFIGDDKEYIEAIREAYHWGSSHFLRKLLYDRISDEILFQQRRMSNIQELQNLTLIEIEKLLEKINRKSLKDFPSIPYPQHYVTTYLGNRLIYAELDYDVTELKSQFNNYFKSLTAVDRQEGRMFFLYNYGGTRKTFMWKTLTSTLRSQLHIFLVVALSGITLLLLPGGRTTHSKFKIHVPTFDDSICNIHQGSELAELLKVTKLIIWDETPMAHKFCFEALDKSLRDIMRLDFCQILLVAPRGSQSDIVHSTINASYIWDHCESGMDNLSASKLISFSQWILDIGDGKISEPNDGYAIIEIPQELLISDFNDPIHGNVNSTYPNLMDQYNNEEYLQCKAILASTIDIVDEINAFVLSLVPGATNSQAWEALTPEFLNSLRTFGLPNHKITLKVRSLIMLLRNIDQSEGLCNGTRLIVTKLANHVIQAKIIDGNKNGNLIYIPRMCMRQFPIMLSYAMTINKSQGQSLECVGLYLLILVFSHGQLYVAISRVKSKQGLKILIHDKEGRPLNTTTNVVFKKVFHNL
ncbi:hypothetical protein JHK87_042481 [Glycine soja]|nr:hypothetical protein JHK87_042481 [Glycine soja]